MYSRGKAQHERRRKKSCQSSAKPRSKRSPVSARCSMSPSRSTCVADFQIWAACPRLLLIVPQRGVAKLWDLHRDLQQVTERGFRTWPGDVPHVWMIQETGSAISSSFFKRMRNELIMQREGQHERGRKKSCQPSAKPRF